MSEYNSDSSSYAGYDSVNGVDSNDSGFAMQPAAHQQRRSSAPQPYHRSTKKTPGVAAAYRRATDDTMSDASDMAGPYEVIEYDLITDPTAAATTAHNTTQGMALTSSQRVLAAARASGGGGEASHSSGTAASTLTNTQMLLADLQALHIQDDSHWRLPTVKEP